MFYNDQYYYVTRIASVFRVSRQTIYNLIKNGKLKAERTNPVRVSGQEINKLIQGGRNV